METFAIEIAGVPVGIRCRDLRNRIFLRDYITEKEPLFWVCPTDADLMKIQDEMDRMEGEHLSHSEGYLENNAIHALLAEKLTAYGVLLMHGSALCMDGQAYIFTAQSGTGKSTHTRLWRETFGDRVWMINDDKPMVRVGAEGVTVYGTPWNGKHNLSRNASAPLKAIISLERDDVNHIEPMPRSDAFPLLMKQSCGYQTPGNMGQIMVLTTQLLNAVAFYRLGCNMEPDAALVAWRGMNEGAIQP